MTELARCNDCRALTLDTDDDTREHRAWHRDYDRKIENTRRAANNATEALAQLRATVRDYEQTLNSRPAPIKPDELIINDFPEDTEDDLHSENDVYDDEPDDDPPSSTTTPTAGFTFTGTQPVI